MKPLVLIADDLTGACDAGVQFSRCGLKTEVLLSHYEMNRIGDNAEAYAINADTRALSKEKAYDRSLSIGLFLQTLGIDRIYKKLDSTLRGHPGVELDAFMDAHKIELAMVIPSYPANGRFVLDGSLYILPHQKLSPFLKDEDIIAGEKKCLDILSLFQVEMKKAAERVSAYELRDSPSNVALKINKLRNDGIEVILFDAVSENDLRSIAFVCSQMDSNYITAGSAGFAPYFSSYNALNCINRTIELHRGYYLFTIGTCNPVTREQVNAVVDQNRSQLITVNTEEALNNSRHELNRITEKVLSLVQRKEDLESLVIAVDSLFGLSPVNSTNMSIQSGEIITKLLGDAVEVLSRKTAIRGLVVSGGETALQVCRKVDADGIRLLTDVEEGVPAGIIMGGVIHGMPLVTKAGGFGSKAVFLNILDYLEAGVRY